MVTPDNTIQFDCFWDDQYRRLNYHNESFNNSEDLQRWASLGYSCKFTGDMCDMRQSQPEWNIRFIEHFSKLGWRNVCTSYYRMQTCTILPVHQDTYKKYIELFDLQGQEQNIRRAIVFLEDWSSGHYLEINGKAYTGWRAGFCAIWNYDEPHMAANIGVEPRYTLQITGHI